MTPLNDIQSIRDHASRTQQAGPPANTRQRRPESAHVQRRHTPGPTLIAFWAGRCSPLRAACYWSLLRQPRVGLLARLGKECAALLLAAVSHQLCEDGELSMALHELIELASHRIAAQDA
jgi:hypothetical protein